MCWHDLLFLHWPVEVSEIQSLLPSGLKVDTFDGRAWVGVVPFTMSGIRARGLPGVPGTSAFAELNVRTYVVCEPGLVVVEAHGAVHHPSRGVWFFSLDAASRMAVRVARAVYHLAYYDARMSSRRVNDGWIEYTSNRAHRGAQAAAFEARYRPVGEASPADPGTLAHFLTERYCLYAADARGRLYMARVWHEPWRLCDAESQIKQTTMTQACGISLSDDEPIRHYAKFMDVEASLPRRIMRGELAAPPRVGGVFSSTSPTAAVSAYTCRLDT